MEKEGIDPSRLTDREIAVLRVLMDKRDIYRANGHRVAANVAGGLVLLVWQVLKHMPLAHAKP